MDTGDNNTTSVGTEIANGAKVALQVGELVLPLIGGPVGAAASGIVALAKELLPVVGPAALHLLDLVLAHKPAEVSPAEWLAQLRSGPEARSVDSYLAEAGADVSGLPAGAPVPTGRGVDVLLNILNAARQVGQLLHPEDFTPTEVETLQALGAGATLGPVGLSPVHRFPVPEIWAR
jgi:hypothetical protein